MIYVPSMHVTWGTLGSNTDAALVCTVYMCIILLGNLQIARMFPGLG